MILKNPYEIKKNYVHIIVGSGPAGISLALALEKKKIPVLIIEAGSEHTSPFSQTFYEGSVYGDNYPDLSIARLRQLGGSSGHWGGICSTLDNNDFNGWPISKKDLIVFESEAKKILDLKGNLSRTKFSRDFDIVNVLSSGVNFAEKYFNYIKKSRYIDLSLNSTFLEFNFLNSKINSININFGKKIYKITSKNYILACGGLENSRIMLWAKSKNIKNFFQEMPIGNYYIDHPTHDVGEGVLDIKKFYKYLKKENIQNNISTKCDSWIYLSPNLEFIEKNKILNNRVDIYYKPFERNDYSKRIFKKLTCLAPSFIKNYLTENENLLDFRIEIHSDQEPLHENRVELNIADKDMYGVPKIKLFWKRSKLVRNTSKITMVELGKFFVHENIGRIGLKDFLFSNKYFLHIGGYHHMGGTRIGFNEKDSVVDKNLKVHSLDNLFICGSSVFRNGGSANPTFTIVQLSLRLGEHLSKLI